MEVKDEDFGFQAIVDEIADLKGKNAETGYFESDVEDDIALAGLMATHEYGATVTTKKGNTIRIPSRPAMRESFDRNVREISDYMFTIGDKIIFEQKISADDGLEIIGDYYKSEFQNGITSRSLDLEENAPITIALKGSDTPLIDTARLVNGINTRVNG